MTQSQEDYLETVSLLSEKTGEARVTKIANELGLSKPSVSFALKMLEEKNLIRHERYGSVILTEKGRELAEGVRQKHELLKTFLETVLGVNSVIAEKDACNMEHALSEETFIKLKDFTEKHIENN